ncbi:hypothetical protein [Ulvibacter antarcticus]|uniref:Lipoprotein n=1 Tax=Ulvibacter antarcticus TaxID=442714 RepID=A0A3L9YWW0_9FLAO|nr:hypothetical protein [Ulvibacter antarcticus]RMA64290.1 hypothetical protein BXY75_1163 [Ulvibacter antarcticus]
MKLYTLLLFSLLLIGCNNTNTNTNNNNSSSTSTSNSGSQYTSKMSKSDKKKFYDQNDNVVYEVKYKSDAFKLRTASSQLIWKVKLYDDKVKISDNEENLNPYEIKIMGAQEAKLTKNDETVARTTYESATSSQTINFEDASQSAITKEMSYSPALLVEAISEIPKDQQQIIISELTDKGY